MTPSSHETSLVLGADRLKRGRGVTAVVRPDGVHVAAVEATSDGEIKLIDSAFAPFPGEASDEHLRPDAIVTLLVATLEQAKLGTRLTTLALPEDLFGSSLGTWPSNVSNQARDVLLSRRIRELVETSEADLIADCRIVGETEEGDDQAFFVWATQPYMALLSSALTSAKLTVEHLVPASIGVLDTFALMRADAEENHIQLIAYIAEPHLVIGVYRGNRPVYVRFLRHVLSDIVDTGETAHAAIVTEVRRTIAFFKENHRGRNIDGVTLHGGPSGMRDVLPSVVGDVPMERFGTEGAVAGDVTALALYSLHSVGNTTFTLLPVTTTRSWRAMAAAGVGVVAALGWIGTSVMTEHAHVAAAREQVAELEQQVDAAGDSFEVDEALSELRDGASWVRTLDVAGVSSVNPINHMLEASAFLPDSLELLNSFIDHGFGDEPGRRFLRLTVETSVAEASAIDTYVDLLSSRPWCQAITSSDTRASLPSRRRFQSIDEVVLADIEVVLP